MNVSNERSTSADFTVGWIRGGSKARNRSWPKTEPPQYEGSDSEVDLVILLKRVGKCRL